MEPLVTVAVASFFAFVISYLSNWLWRIKGEKAVFSNRLQFEKEFDIYQRLWADLVDVVQAAEALGHGSTAGALEAAHRKAADSAFKFSPFYETGVFQGAKSVLATAEQCLQSKSAPASQVEALRRQMETVSMAIRARIWPAA